MIAQRINSCDPPFHGAAHGQVTLRRVDHGCTCSYRILRSPGLTCAMASTRVALCRHPSPPHRTAARPRSARLGKTRIFVCRDQIDAALNVSHYYSVMFPSWHGFITPLTSRDTAFARPGETHHRHRTLPAPVCDIAPSYMLPCSRFPAVVPKPVNTPGEARCAIRADAASNR
jgi:hypothetical protein